MKKYFLALVIVSLLLVGCSDKENTSSDLSKSIVPVEPNGGITDIGKNNAISLFTQDEAAAKILEQYVVPFSTERLTELQGKQKFMIFFHADWCPTCIRWGENVAQNLTELPDTTTILIADYDNNAVRNAFGISRQSTAIFYDAEGNRVNDVLDPAMEDLVSFFSS